ncbi:MULTISPECIES: hypothetical protein [Rhodopseudomonas]|uniref:Uncharacterized protein n=1 Tax=Rhodopseudomonas palustris TaxID=1076 RepID=A0A0D7F379_RHOPL|nr:MULTISPECIES: hypothetical protein [Rhodopseudomonas]KIZ47230.1 hypothetical protein OO17_05485 [Rhodopseudomonas palustris]MDF3812612.1 hypothetical protein [Rhodopseudomonas sp. BAL398]WOK17715.1 hypothetical protein RBJ75_26980 [Rhodopseudomonas sp. BAL398]
MTNQRLFLFCAGIGLGAGLVAATRRAGEAPRRISAQRRGEDATSRARSQATVTAARRLNRAAGLLATSVLADSGVEHYRGSFKNKAMYTPLVVSALTLGVSLHGTADKRPAAHLSRDAVYALAAATGLIGTGFHIYNVGKKLGGFCWQNLFYAAPLGAPMAILLSGLIGFSSERVRESRRDAAVRPEIFTLPAGRTLAAVTGAGLLGTTGEAALLHFRGAYHNPLMLLPVTLPPVGALLLAGVAAKFDAAHWLPRAWMWLLVAMGFGGAGLHAYGVSRNMGGFANWSQNILSSPPLPAPPSFSGLALAGLACLDLIREHPDA